MNKSSTTVLFAGVVLILSVQCKKCYTCSADLPVMFNGIALDTTVYYEENVCGRPWQAQPEIEAYESQGYECVEDSD